MNGPLSLKRPISGERAKSGSDLTSQGYSRSERVKKKKASIKHTPSATTTGGVLFIKTKIRRHEEISINQYAAGDSSIDPFAERL